MLQVILFFLFLLASSFTLRERVDQAHAGDFIVTEQSKTYSVLFIRSLSNTTLQLEEISTPHTQVKSINNAWKEWVQKGAPGHSAWVVYTIDLNTNSLKECYSFDRKGWIAVDDQDSFLSRLLSLPLQRQAVAARKRIGPPPVGGEEDRRAFWAPPIVVEGKKIERPAIEVLTTTWPKDTSPLSLCEVELYFDTKRPTFLFPSWIEIKSPHYAHHVRVVDAGSGMHSLHAFLPSKPIK